MTYKLEFLPIAKKEWEKLGATIKEQLKKKLAKRLCTPHVPKDIIKGGTNLYKIKLRTSGYRLVYEVNDNRLTVLVIIIGQRNQNQVYKKLFTRL